MVLPIVDLIPIAIVRQTEPCTVYLCFGCNFKQIVKSFYRKSFIIFNWVGSFTPHHLLAVSYVSRLIIFSLRKCHDALFIHAKKEDVNLCEWKLAWQGEQIEQRVCVHCAFQRRATEIKQHAPETIRCVCSCARGVRAKTWQEIFTLDISSLANYFRNFFFLNM